MYLDLFEMRVKEQDRHSSLYYRDLSYLVALACLANIEHGALAIDVYRYKDSLMKTERASFATLMSRASA